MPAGLFGKCICNTIDRLAEREWQSEQAKTGSEMYALVKRNANAAINVNPQRDAA